LYTVGFADSRRQVECDFTDKIICGYVTSQLGSWRWFRKNIKDKNPLTGPDADPHDNPTG